MAFSFPVTNAARTQQFAMALYGIQLGTSTLTAVQDDIANNGGFTNTINSYFTYSFGSLPTATVAANLVQNVGITTGAADAITYVKAILDTTPAASRGVAVEGILNAFSKMTGDAVYGAAATYYNNRLSAAISYTGVNDVTVGTSSPSQTVPLTTGADVFGGSNGDDTYLAAEDTLNPLDVINGGAGNDTLKIDAGDDLQGSISGIENLVYVGRAYGMDPINAAKVGGLQTVTFQDASELHSDGEYRGVEIENLQSGNTVRIEGTINSETNNYDDADEYTIIHAHYQKDATVANLVLINADETKSGYIDYSAVGTSTDTLKTLNVSGNTKYVSASNNTTLDLLVGSTQDDNGIDNEVNKISTLNVNSYAGGTLKIDASDEAGYSDGIGKNLTTIDATASAGKTIIDISGYGKDLTYKGGASDDILIMDFDKLTAKDSIVGGSGFDSLRLNVDSDGSDVPTYTLDGDDNQIVTDEGYTFLNATGFEQVGFWDIDTGNDDLVLNMNKLTASSVRMETDLAASNVSDSDVFIDAHNESTWFTLTHARSTVGPAYDYTGEGVVNVTVEASQDVNIMDVVVGESESGATQAESGYSDFAKLVLSGAGTVYFYNEEADTADTAGGAIVDASAMTGTSSLEFAGNINQTDYVTLGAGKDFVGIYGSTTTLFDRVTGFSAADKIMITDTDGDESWVGKLTIDSGVTSASGAISNALAQMGEDEVAYFQFGGNTYVVQDDEGDASAIQLVGALTLTSANIDYSF